MEETLKHLGMPPNRGDEDRGFMVWETDGKKSVAHAMSHTHPMAYCMLPPEPATAGHRDSWFCHRPRAEHRRDKTTRARTR